LAPQSGPTASVASAGVPHQLTPTWAKDPPVFAWRDADTARSVAVFCWATLPRFWARLRTEAHGFGRSPFRAGNGPPLLRSVWPRHGRPPGLADLARELVPAASGPRWTPLAHTPMTGGSGPAAGATPCVCVHAAPAGVWPLWLASRLVLPSRQTGSWSVGGGWNPLHHCTRPHGAHAGRLRVSCRNIGWRTDTS